jgi:hypothetical protein
MGFHIAGSLSGATPIIRNFQISETMYEGQLVMADAGIAGISEVQIADVGSEAHENDQPIIGIVSGVINENRAYDATYRGYKATYSTTQADIAAYGAATVQVSLIRPWDTLVWGAIYNAAYGTALTVCTCTSENSGGTTIAHTGNSITDIPDDFVTVYCRTGANRGIYRVATTTTATQTDVTVPFPYTIAVGDTFVVASCKLGIGYLDIPATANCIDGNNNLDAYYDVFYHEINLEEAGKEYAVFSFLPKACGPMAA